MTEECGIRFTGDSSSVEQAGARAVKTLGEVDRAQRNIGEKGSRAGAGDERQWQREWGSYQKMRERGLQDVERITEKYADRAERIQSANLAKRERAERESASRVDQYLKGSDSRRMDSADASARHRTNALTEEMRALQRLRGVKDGLNREGGSSHGAREGHGGLLAGNTRMIGDLLDQATGHSGWVMRLNGLQHLGKFAGPALAGGLSLGALAAGVGANVESATRDRALGEAMGERTESAVWANPLTRPWARLVGADRVGSYYRGDAHSGAGMTAERESIQRALESEDPNKMGFAAQVAQGWSDYLDPRQRDARYAHQQTAVNRLGELDERNAALVVKRTAADRLGITDEHEGAMAKLRVERDEKKAEIDDQVHENKIGALEAKRRRDAADARFADAATAERRRVAVVGHENEAQGLATYYRARGVDVQANTAYSQYQLADRTYHSTIGKEAREKADLARGAAWQDYVEAQRATDRDRATQKVELSQANFRGGAEARVSQAAESALTVAKIDRDSALKGHTADSDEARAAELVVAQKKLALDLTKQELAAANIGRQAAIRTGELSISVGASRLTNNRFTANEAARFSAGQAITRTEAEAKVARAEIGLTAANQKVANEKASGGASEDTLNAQKLAVQEVTRAKQEQAEVTRQLAFEDQERTHHLQLQLGAAERMTAAMRLQTLGRGDLAGLAQSRGESRTKAAEFRREGKEDMAREIEAQQVQRELQHWDSKHLTDDGHRRLPYEVQKEEREKQRTAARIERANERLTHGREHGLHSGGLRSGGLATSGLDADPYRSYPRKDRSAPGGKDHGDAHSQYLSDILKALQDRLPAEQ